LVCQDGSSTDLGDGKMMDKILLLPLIIPFLGGILALLMPRNWGKAKEGASLVAALLNLIVTIIIFKTNLRYLLPWGGFGLEFSLRLYNFSAFIIASAAFFGFLTMLYSIVFMRGKQFLSQFYAYFLFILAFINGAVLADNLVLMLFFWEGSLAALFGLIAIGGKAAFKTATKAFIILGVADLCMMFGIALTANIAGTLTISNINLPLGSLSSLAFILLMIGAISKAGSMPFHSWIPDAATDAPVPFMALMPAALEKLLGIYFLTRISLDLFRLNPHSSMSILMMTIGSITIILAVMMALIQKDYKRLLSYHAISQVGYMILGIGTAIPVGIIGGLFHMVNNALYKSCLFLTSGSVERQTGTTNLEELGGLRVKMPITFVCFAIAAVSISGVPPFNGFFSKELVYDGALERGWIFYFAAVLGSFLTAASFLKLGHAAFLGKPRDRYNNVKEVPWTMLLPMILIAATCVIFGVFNYLPIKYLIQPVLGEHLAAGHKFYGMPSNALLVIITVFVLFAALLNHLFGVKRTGSGIKAVDHIHYAPVLSTIYSLAEKRFFDPYNWGMGLVNLLSRISRAIDKIINWFYDGLSVNLGFWFSRRIRKMHTGNFSVYLSWSLLGMLAIFILLVVL
jgi:NADH-quinone oxidoreductase subunit L